MQMFLLKLSVYEKNIQMFSFKKYANLSKLQAQKKVFETFLSQRYFGKQAKMYKPVYNVYVYFPVTSRTAIMSNILYDEKNMHAKP